MHPTTMGNHIPVCSWISTICVLHNTCCMHSTACGSFVHEIKACHTYQGLLCAPAMCTLDNPRCHTCQPAQQSKQSLEDQSHMESKDFSCDRNWRFNTTEYISVQYASLKHVWMLENDSPWCYMALPSLWQSPLLVCHLYCHCTCKMAHDKPKTR